MRNRLPHLISEITIISPLQQKKNDQNLRRDNHNFSNSKKEKRPKPAARKILEVGKIYLPQTSHSLFRILKGETGDRETAQKACGSGKEILTKPRETARNRLETACETAGKCKKCVCVPLWRFHVMLFPPFSFSECFYCV